MRTLSRVTCAVLAGTALFGVVGLSSTATAAPARPLGATATVIGDGRGVDQRDPSVLDREPHLGGDDGVRARRSR